MKEKLARHKKSSKNSMDTVEPRQRVNSITNSISSSDMDPPQDVCEICERPGHDIFNCDLLKEDTPSILNQPRSNVMDLFCEDCENHGHVAADCPHSLDVF